MFKRKPINILLFILITISLCLPTLTRAAEIYGYKLEQGIPFISAAKDTEGNPIVLNYEQFSTLFKKFITTVYIIAAVAAFIKLFMAGLKWYTSGGSSKAISQAKEDIKNALIGLVFLFLAGTLLVFINPNLNKLSDAFDPGGGAMCDQGGGSTGESGGSLLKISSSPYYYAQATLSTKLNTLTATAYTNTFDPPGFRYTITTGCRINSNGNCDPNYCGSSPYDCTTCSMGSDSCGKPLSPTPCHFNGACVDLVPTSVDYAAAITKLNGAGLDVLNESGDKCGDKITNSNDHLHVALPGNIKTTGGCFTPGA